VPREERKLLKSRDVRFETKCADERRMREDDPDVHGPNERGETRLFDFGPTKVRDQ
jgi:hypothetical protein